jgi:hypothetical protein
MNQHNCLDLKPFTDEMPTSSFYLLITKNQVMSITLDAGPLLRALYVLLITCTALLAMPSRAGAQIYVSQV